MSHKLKPAFKKKERPIIVRIVEERPPAPPGQRERQGSRDYTLKDLLVEQRRCIGETDSGKTFMFSRERYYNAEGRLVRELIHAFRPYNPDF